MKIKIAEAKEWSEPPPNPMGRSQFTPASAEIVFRSSDKTYSIGNGYALVPHVASEAVGPFNSISVTIKQDGIHYTTKKPYVKKVTVRIDAKHVKVDPEGQYVDLPGWHKSVKGVISKDGDLLDTEGKTIATREEQVKLARAYMKWPKVK